MQATVNAHQLKQAVNWLYPVVPRPSLISILSSVAISKPTATHLKVEATDLTTRASYLVPATGQPDGTLLVEAQALKKYLAKAARSKQSALTIDGDSLSCNAVAVTLPRSGEPEDYPLPPQVDHWDNETTLDLDSLDLAAIAKFTGSPDDGRVVLTHILVEVLTNGTPRLVAADGFQLVIAGQLKPDMQTNTLLPPTAVKLLAKLKGKAQLYHNGDLACIGNETVKIHANSDPGKFPDWRYIYNALNTTSTANVSKQHLGDALDIIATLGDKRCPTFVLSATDGKATLTVDKAEHQFEASIAALVEQPFKIELDAKRLKTLLALCNDSVTLHFDQPNRPVYIQQGDLTMILMPIIPRP